MINESPRQAAHRLSAHLLNKGFKPQALHEYQDANGLPIFWKIRLKNISDNQKWIRPIHCVDNGEFIFGEPRFVNKKPLYYLPSIINSLNETIWIVEGEYCADQLTKLGLIATTSGGVDSVHSADWSILVKRKIIIWPDNDKAGFKYAELITQQLLENDCIVELIDIEKLSLPPKGDCIDWLRAHPEADLAELNCLPRISSLLPKPLPIATQNSVADSPFHLESGGVYYCDNEISYWVCSKLEVNALTRDDHSENWGRLLTFLDADKKMHYWAMPMQMLKGNAEELCGELLRLGLEIAPGSKARKLLLEYITTAKIDQRAVCVNRTGWYQHVFVFPDHTFGKTSEQIIYQAEILTRDYKRLGTFEKWRSDVAQLCIGNSRLMLAISCAFAAMLLQPLSMESGGIHFVGASSTGKTTALRIAASVYGAPDYVSRWRATTNGLEALAALRSDTLLILDELAQIDPREAGEVAYLLANGMGKARASKTGMARSRHEWRLLFLSAGEVNLEQHMREGGKKIKAGQEIRLVDIPADAGMGLGVFETIHHFPSAAAFSKSLLDAASSNYGYAAYTFLEQITLPENLASLPVIVRKLCDQFINDNLPANSGGQVHRVCERFALIAAGGELASQYNITGWLNGEATLAVQKCFQDWIQQRGNVGNQERVTILSQIKSFFEAHAESRFSDWDRPDSKTTNRAGFKKIELGQIHFYVLPEIFRQEICTGLDTRLTAQILAEEGWILPCKGGSPYRREYLPSIGRSRCYVFTAKMWSAD